jgi:uncharacterized protein YlxW (UPF0749 family)
MAKKRKTVSIDEDVHNQLSSQEHINASSIVNELLRQYLFQGESQDAALHMRKKDLEKQIEETRQEITHLESKVERLQDEKEQVKQMIQDRRREGIKEIEKFADIIQQGDFAGEIEPDNPAVQNYAQDANMTPTRFVQEVEDQL